MENHVDNYLKSSIKEDLLEPIVVEKEEDVWSGVYCITFYREEMWWLVINKYMVALPIERVIYSKGYRSLKDACSDAERILPMGRKEIEKIKILEKTPSAIEWAID